ncbi:hypothetical protein RhiirA1_444650 [Rhizophagus irregularis]|uniref:Uncharacterized protein n=1 Tax=Rhizophagus irregularis TaxID=588596 RepID=A0A2N0RCH7_9GLOM|nr:hypothetical protein RhiirA1_444650 [Rhizophagus irregularis]
MAYPSRELNSFFNYKIHELTVLTKILHLPYAIHATIAHVYLRVVGLRSRGRFNIFDWPDWPHDLVMFICLSNLIFSIGSRSYNSSGSTINKDIKLKSHLLIQYGRIYAQ